MLTNLLFALFAFAIGLVLLLWGYRAFLAMLPIFGFFAGLWLGAHTISVLFGSGFLADVTGLIVGLVTGLVFAVLSYLFYALGIALVAGTIGYALGSGLTQALGINAALLVAFVGIILAVLAILLVFRFNLQKYVIIALTAIAGANVILLSGLVLFGRISPDAVRVAGSAIQPVLQDGWFWSMVWLVVAIVGIGYQIRNNRVYTFSPDEYETGWGLPD
jgi:hypothetical protein